MKLVDYRCLLCNFILICVHLFLFSSVATAQQRVSVKDKNNDRLCNQSIETLASLLSEDITDYGNRVIQKSRIYSHELNFLPTYIVAVSQPETEPLPLPQFPISEQNSSSDEVQQIFLTSLERRYSNNQTVIEAENYHWLLMTKVTNQWHLVMAFTRFGYPTTNGDDFLASPLRDTTEGTIGQAVNLWLRDCRAGTLKELRIDN